MSLSSPLSHLSAEELSDLISRYYAGEKVAMLLVDFNIRRSVSSLTRYFPPELTDLSCKYCRSQLIRPRYPRGQTYEAEICCSVCDHEESPRCGCPGCEKVRREAHASRLAEERVRVFEFCKKLWDYEPIYIEPMELSAREAVTLISLVRSAGWHDGQTLSTLKAASIRFAPAQPDFQLSLILRLIETGIVAPDPKSHLSAFRMDKSGIVEWDINLVDWVFRCADPVCFVQELEDIVASDRWPESWTDECIDLSHGLAVAECREFFEYSAAKRGFPMPGVTAQNALIKNLLRDFSVSQCYELMWAAGKVAADYHVRKKISFQQAANSMIGACQRHADRARAEGWVIKGHARNFDLERTQISHVLHDFFFQRGEVCFTSVLPKPGDVRKNHGNSNKCTAEAGGTFPVVSADKAGEATTSMVSPETAEKLKTGSLGELIASLPLINIKPDQIEVRIPNDYLTPLELPSMFRGRQKSDD